MIQIQLIILSIIFIIFFEFLRRTTGSSAVSSTTTDIYKAIIGNGSTKDKLGRLEETLKVAVNTWDTLTTIPKAGLAVAQRIGNVCGNCGAKLNEGASVCCEICGEDI